MPYNSVLAFIYKKFGILLSYRPKNADFHENIVMKNSRPHLKISHYSHLDTLGDSIFFGF